MDPEFLHPRAEPDDLQGLLEQLLALRRYLSTEANRILAPLPQPASAGDAARSRCNLAQYLALRRFDLRELQDALTRNGLSSLGRSESHVQATLDQIITLLARALGVDAQDTATHCVGVSFVEGRELLERNADRVLGPRRGNRAGRIMVTLASNEACDPAHVRALIDAGMDCARINCAHDSPAQWKIMIDNVRTAAADARTRCRVIMDLAGRKLRTGPIGSPTAMLRLKPVRNDLGQRIAPARLALIPLNSATPEPLPTRTGELPQLGMDPDIWATLSVGDRLELRDARGKRRRLRIELSESERLLACSDKTVYLTPDTRLHVRRRSGRRDTINPFSLSGFAQSSGAIRLLTGDRLILDRLPQPGSEPVRDQHGTTVEPARIGCLGEVDFTRLQAGDAVSFDDGKIDARILTVQDEWLELKITRADARGSRLLADKGINLPQLSNSSALTAKDLADLDFIVSHADGISYSFVETAMDMQCLHEALIARNAHGMPVLAKIETQAAVRNLPQILLACLGQRPIGVMIARGDLAIELGAERLAEIQEEILWICEAAHVPVVWATQVMETLVKKGRISRPEITDAAMSNRAECVMLNKGTHVLEALATLGDILERMDAHQHKKSPRLRALHW